jgi:RNA polymerase sigma factor (sigma-70 family)
MVKQSEPIDFAELVTAAQHGDSKSMDTLVREVEPRLRGFIYRSTFDRQSLDDLVQETLLKMITSLPGLRKAESFWPWLFCVARTSMNSYFRKYGCSAVVPFSTLRHQMWRQSLEDYRKSRHDSAQQEVGAIVDESISKLKTGFRTVVCMRCFHNMSYAQISASIGLSQRATRTLFFRAKQRIRKDLENSLPSITRA